MIFAPQRHTIFDLSSPQMALHPPLWRAYYATLRSHKTLEQNSASPLFALLHLLASDSLSSLIFFLLLFSSLTHLCFFICPYSRKLTSKLPSIILGWFKDYVFQRVCSSRLFRFWCLAFLSDWISYIASRLMARMSFRDGILGASKFIVSMS